MNINEIYTIALALITSASASLVGSFALMKRMTLAGDAISHVALPGIGLALLFGINPILGGAAALFLGVLLIWNLEKRTGLATETMIGVVFSASLAVGALITPQEELEHALFGGFAPMSMQAFAMYTLLALAVILSVLALRHRLVLGLFSSDLALASGVKLNRLNLYFLLLFGLTIILGLRLLGALLVGSLIIIPAAIGRQLAHTFSGFITTSILAGLLAVALGFGIAGYYGLEAGPTIVTVAAGLFILSSLKKRK